MVSKNDAVDLNKSKIRSYEVKSGSFKVKVRKFSNFMVLHITIKLLANDSEKNRFLGQSRSLEPEWGSFGVKIRKLSIIYNLSKESSSANDSLVIQWFKR